MAGSNSKNRNDIVKSFLLVRTAFLLICSNTFMTFAWYSHLRNWNDKKWYVAAILSWGIALFEYLFQVPANRVGYTALNLPQLKILQEVITLFVFAPYAVLYMHQAIRLDYLWAGLCLVGAVYFIFRS
jgi:uncharacterized protein